MTEIVREHDGQNEGERRQEEEEEEEEELGS